MADVLFHPLTSDGTRLALGQAVRVPIVSRRVNSPGEIPES
jgi:hypothetical protein